MLNVDQEKRKAVREESQNVCKEKNVTKKANSISSKCLGSEMVSEEIQLPDTLGLEPAFLFPPRSHYEKG